MFTQNLLIFIISLTILIKSSDLLVDYAAKLAKHFNISDFTIGVTLVAIGTSLPEMGSSIVASLLHKPDLVFGTIVGSNIANIGLIVGITAIFTVLNIKKEIWYKDGLLLLLFTIVFGVFAIDGSINLIEGVICIILFLFYIRRIIINKNRFTKNKFLINKSHKKGEKKFILWLVIILLSIGALVFSARFVVSSASNLAEILGISETIIAALILAVGTSLPELIVSLSAMKKKMGDLLIGNIIGSNISNLFLVGGVSAIITPLVASPIIFYFLIPAMIIFTIIFIGLIRTNWLLKMFDGLILTILYIIFVIILFFLM